MGGCRVLFPSLKTPRAWRQSRLVTKRRPDAEGQQASWAVTGSSRPSGWTETCSCLAAREGLRGAVRGLILVGANDARPGRFPSLQAELEMDMLREQVSVHRTEFADLEASTSRKISELELLLTAERHKASDASGRLRSLPVGKPCRGGRGRRGHVPCCRCLGLLTTFAAACSDRGWSASIPGNLLPWVQGMKFALVWHTRRKGSFTRGSGSRRSCCEAYKGRPRIYSS